MSNSRRGLLAAGLSAVVVGSLGVVWTLNASADETSPAADVVAEASAAPAATDATEPPVTVETPATEEAGQPPKLLPWGAKPHRLKRARAGASSEAVAAAGADVAPADRSGSLVPEAEFAPKGFADPGKGPRRTRAVPPMPPGVKAMEVDDDVDFHYGTSEQKGETDGTWANLTIEKPRIAPGEYHSLAEIAVRGPGNVRQVVEVGWHVDPAMYNGNADPHLFVFHWVDGVPQCYNACGWVSNSRTMRPGDVLPVGLSKRFGIQRGNAAWWIAYDSEYIGAFPFSNWDNRFLRAQTSQWFGEVAVPEGKVPCSDMGNGKPAADEYGSRIGSIAMSRGGPDVLVVPEVDSNPKRLSSYYNVAKLSDTTFRYGGPRNASDELPPGCLPPPTSPPTPPAGQ